MYKKTKTTLFGFLIYLIYLQGSALSCYIKKACSLLSLGLC